MILGIFITLISLIFLSAIHEFGHFILAKRFGVKVKEFGLGYPPRIFAKKIGETIYSVNWLPFGAFVKIFGEEEDEISEGSFSHQKIWRRALVVLGGVISFWLISIIIFSIVFAVGVPTVVSDEEKIGRSPHVLITDVSPNSPAQIAGLETGDIILFIKTKDEKEELKITKINEIKNFITTHSTETIILTIQRGKEIFDISLIPRVLPPAGEGPMGVVLVRAVIFSYPWYKAPIKGIVTSFFTTIAIIKGYALALANVFRGLPTGVQLMGPVGIGNLIVQSFAMGFSYFLQFFGLISIYLAIFNVFPIPVVDGGKLLFLLIEKIKGRPINRKIEQNINAIFFMLLVFLAILVTIKDIRRLF